MTDRQSSIALATVWSVLGVTQALLVPIAQSGWLANDFVMTIVVGITFISAITFFLLARLVIEDMPSKDQEPNP